MRIRLISSDYLKLYRIINIVMRFDLMKQLNGTRLVFCVMSLQNLFSSNVASFLKFARSLPVVPALAETPD